MPRRYVGCNQTIVGGVFTGEELEACRAVGAVNAYRQPLDEVVARLEESALPGWQVAAGGWTHRYDDIPVPEIANARTEPILLGFVRVIRGDPHYPLWIYSTRARA